MTEPAPGLPNLYTEREAAQYLRVGVHTLGRLRRAGRVPHLKLGKTVRYSDEDLLGILEALRCEPSTAPAATGSSTAPTEASMSSPGGTPSAAETVDAQSGLAILDQRRPRPTHGTPRKSADKTAKPRAGRGSRTR